ncbi:MAG: DUF1538 domain-containing protein [Clostridia bacterium]|nr:DUF1538 domain-containing protein [Clostridia bacterium]
MKTKTILMEKIKESLASVLPVSLIILVLSFTITPLPNHVFISFLSGTFLMIFGMGLFTLGVDKSMTPMGEHVGSTMTKSRKVWMIVLVSFFIGTLITVSEPDLTVLAAKVPAIETSVFIWTVGLGVGVFLVFAVLRIVLAIKLRYLLFASYGIIFLLAAFVPADFLAVAFDAGGVTTGPLTVPFIMAMGVGIASISSDESGDSFGLMALCSAGPIIAILVLGLIYPVEGASYVPESIVEFTNTHEFGGMFIGTLPHQLKDVATGLFPVVIFFFIYQIFAGRVHKDQIPRLLIGVLYTYVGIVMFLMGATTGFLPVADHIGNMLATSDLKWLLVPIGMLLGYFIVLAEPAVHVLEKQVEEATAGSIPKKMLSVAMSIAVAIAVGLAMVRALTGISVLWFVGIGYAIALGLAFIVPEEFTSIAFDSGGVASGAMTSTFLMPLSVGVTYAIGGNVMSDGFGMIAMVAMLPPITVQILGLIYRIKTRRSREYVVDFDNSIIEMDIPFKAESDPLMMTTEFPIYKEEPKTSEEYPDIIEFSLP